MEIRTKGFLIFQIAVAIVTTMLASLYFIMLSYITNDRFYFDSCIIACSIYTISYALFLFPAWRLWNGKNWYSLSLLLFSLITGFAVICFIIGMIDTGDLGFSLVWGAILLYIVYLPFIIISSCLIGLIGKYISKKYNREVS